MITIQISDKLWGYLNKKKQRGETFNNVLIRELKLNSEHDKLNAKAGGKS